MMRLSRVSRVVLAWVLLLSWGSAARVGLARELDAQRHSDSPYFSPEIFLGHVYYLASDELGGRGVGTPGIDRAAGYIADQFASAGIEPAGEEGTYFQPVQVPLGGRIEGEGELAIEGGGLGAPVIEADYVPFPWSASGSFDGEVVFAGYGLVNADKDYDDYSGIEVSGKVVLMLRREPPSWSVGLGFSDLARFDNKVAEARKHGAVAVLIANRKPDEGEEDRLMPFFGRVGREDYGLPAFQVTRALADKLLGSAKLDSLAVMQQRLDADNPRQCSAVLAGIRVKGRADLRRDVATSDNVVGLIQGTGRQWDEYVVIGAHYDHLGRRPRRSLFGRRDPEGKVIYNGADDNASGTAGVIELGKALARSGNLNRSVLLIAFTGEELGLHGSRHYAEFPTVPRDRIVAMLNMDMIGRMDEDGRLTAYGVGTGEGFEDLVHRCAGEVGLEIELRRPVSGRSDATPFYELGIPAMFFFAGLHPDYHQPTDDAEKINEQGAARIVQMAYAVARELIDRETEPTYCYVPGRAAIGDEPVRAVMGFWPGSPDATAGEGVVVSRTAPNGPAARAGIQAGDRIVRIDGQEIGDTEDYARVTAGKRPGDTVEVVVVREGREFTLTVTFAAG